MRKLTSFSKAICSLALFGVACSGNDTSSGPPNTSVGGDASTGGTIASSNGGAPLGSAGTTSTTGNSTGGKAAGGATSSSGTGGNATGGATSTNIATGGAATGGAAAGGTTSNGTGGNSVGGTISTGGSVASATGTGGKATGGTTSTGGTATSSSATGGKATGGGTSSSGTGGKATGGATTTGTGGKATGGVAATGGLSSGTGGGTGVTVSSTCKVQTWPTPTGSTVTISGTKSVTNYDGGGALHEGNLNDCSIGDQSSTKAIIEVANGGSVKNVIFGKNVGDGIHCLGSCTIDNVWFPYICDDAITINRDGTGTAASTISNSGFKGARDKILQHNGGNMTLNITNVYAEVGGKLYRSCGSGGGCTTSANHTVNVSNVVAIGVNQIVGISTNDHATLKNICTFRSPVLCNTYQVNSDNDSTAGANGTGEGPGANCSYTAADTHALVDRVGGVTLTTDVLCPGSNSVKSGSSATACITGFENCLKVCAAGMYGFKQMGCTSGSYTSSATGGCALVNSATDSAAATALAGTRAATATTSVTKNTSCSTQWALGKDSSNSANTCECVEKPGYYQQSTGSAQPATWMVWDCQSQWW